MASAHIDDTTNFICHIWNNDTRERQYYRDGGVHLAVFHTYVYDFVNDYIENCSDEAIHYYISVINGVDPNTILKLYGHHSRDVRQVNANQELERIQEYLPQQPQKAPTVQKTIRKKV